jgi:hypothetical protein
MRGWIFRYEPASGAPTDMSEPKKTGQAATSTAHPGKGAPEHAEPNANPLLTTTVIPRPNAGTGGDPTPAKSRNARHLTSNRKDNYRQTSAQRLTGGSPGPTRGGIAARNKSNESTTTTSSSNSPGRANTSARTRAQAAGKRKGERTTGAPEDTRASLW